MSQGRAGIAEARPSAAKRCLFWIESAGYFGAPTSINVTLHEDAGTTPAP